MSGDQPRDLPCLPRGRERLSKCSQTFQCRALYATPTAPRMSAYCGCGYSNLLTMAQNSVIIPTACAPWRWSAEIAELRPKRVDSRSCAAPPCRIQSSLNIRSRFHHFAVRRRTVERACRNNNTTKSAEPAEPFNSQVPKS